MNLLDELGCALRTMLVATDSSAKLPKGHPGHEAYLCSVAKPRAEAALLRYKKSSEVDKKKEEATETIGNKQSESLLCGMCGEPIDGTCYVIKGIPFCINCPWEE